MYENYGWKFALTALLAALSIWGIESQEMSLGLDLQGGAQLVYKLDVRERGWLGLDTRMPKETEKDKNGLYVTTVTAGSPRTVLA